MTAPKIIKKAKLSFIFWLARRLPTCREIAPVISQSLDRPLSLRERVTLRLHLFTCSYCVEYLRQLRFLGEAFRACDMDDESAEGGPALSADSRQRMKDALKQVRP